MNDSNVIKGYFGHGRTILGTRLATALSEVALNPIVIRYNEHLIAVGAFATAASCFEEILSDLNTEEAKHMENALCGIMEGLAIIILEQREKRILKNIKDCALQT
jgi:hypothetical protein